MNFQVQAKRFFVLKSKHVHDSRRPYKQYEQKVTYKAVCSSILWHLQIFEHVGPYISFLKINQFDKIAIEITYIKILITISP